MDYETYHAQLQNQHQPVAARRPLPGAIMSPQPYPSEIYGVDNNSGISSTPLYPEHAPFSKDEYSSSTIELQPADHFNGSGYHTPNHHHGARPKKSRQGIHWPVPTIAFLLFLVGVATAIGHHVYLSSLNGKPTDNQIWTQRYSLALAFVAKTALTAAIASAWQQTLWNSLRHTRRGISISGIDSLMGLLGEPFGFLKWEIWRSAFPAMILGGFIWLSPLVNIVTPTSLSTGIKSFGSGSIDCTIPSFDLLSTDTSTGSMPLSENHGTDGVQFASPLATKMATLTAYNGKILDWASPCGSNCSYTQNIVGPAWQCYNADKNNASAAVALANVSYWGESYATWHHAASYSGNWSSDTGYLWVGYSSIKDDQATNQDDGLDITYFCTALH
jgi:hypothetical protein